jgi:hypothetical protein
LLPVVLHSSPLTSDISTKWPSKDKTPTKKEAATLPQAIFTMAITLVTLTQTIGTTQTQTLTVAVEMPGAFNPSLVKDTLCDDFHFM